MTRLTPAQERAQFELDRQAWAAAHPDRVTAARRVAPLTTRIAALAAPLAAAAARPQLAPVDQHLAEDWLERLRRLPCA